MSSDARYFLVLTDLEPDQLGAASIAIYEQWVAFAMGQADLGGKKLVHPTGRYASSIKVKKYNAYRVAIVADETAAPEGIWLEEGHDRVDLLTKYPPGKRLAMHRGGSQSMSPRLDTSKGARKRNIWAQVKESGLNGSAVVPSKRPAGGNTSGTDQAWVIPAMAAYSPAAHLVDLFKQRLK